MKKTIRAVIMFLVVGLLLPLGMIQANQQPVMAADNSVQKIKDKGVLVMGTSADYAPYEFLDGNEIVGMDIEIGKKIAADLGVKLQVKNMKFDSLLVALETGKVDMVLSALTPTKEREQSVDMSKVYYKGGQSIIVNKAQAALYKDKNSFIGKSVGVQTGSLQNDLAKKQISHAKILGLSRVPDLVQALKTHRIDGIVAEAPVAQAYAQNDDSLTAIDGKFDLGNDMLGSAIAFPKGSTALVNAANQSIDQIQKKGLIKTYLKTAGSYMASNTQNSTMLHYWNYFAKGVGYTLLISLISAFFGILLGVLLALARLGKNKVLHGLSVAYIEFVRGTPLMIQVMFVFFGVGMLFKVPALLAGIIAVSLNSAAYVAEIIRSGIVSIPKGQTEAARSLGLSKRLTMQTVVLPQAIKNIWPALGNEFISLIKESSIVSIIGVTDLIYELTAVQTATYKGIAPIMVAMVLYFVMTFGLSKILGYFERKMKHD